MASEAKKFRASFLSVSETYRLNVACAPLSDAFGGAGPFHVGSSLTRADYRDGIGDLDLNLGGVTVDGTNTGDWHLTLRSLKGQP